MLRSEHRERPHPLMLRSEHRERLEARATGAASVAHPSRRLLSSLLRVRCRVLLRHNKSP